MVFNIAIIGLGQRGLSTLERLSALYDGARDGTRFLIHVIDPGLPGQGAHLGSQPSHLITNTTTAQTTVFVDHSVVGAGPPRPGPTYAEWLWLSGHRHRDGAIGPEGGPIPDDTYTPRALLGAYLAWCYRHVVEGLPEGLRVVEHRERAVAIDRAPGGAWSIGLACGEAVRADYLFLTTGHESHGPADEDVALEAAVGAARAGNRNLAFHPAMAAPGALDAIPASARVLVCGSGLTAADVISTLTQARGGAFAKSSARRLTYRPSGREPTIALYSRQGLPAGAKGVNQKTIGRNYEPRLFTIARVDRLRAQFGQLDWDRDLLPCLKSEMAACYVDCLERTLGRPLDAAARRRVEGLIDRIIDPWADERIESEAGHRDFICAHLADDIDAAFMGNRSDPLKAISEMLRDLNDVVRHAVDHAGLTPDSHRAFLSRWVSINNRIAAGPPKERNMELLALIEAGIVSMLPPDPSVTLDEARACFRATSEALGSRREAEFDVLIRARVGAFHVDRSRSAFFASGRASGLFAPFANGSFSPGGLAIDRALNVLDAAGRPIPTMWAMGHVVEGPHYYTYVLPCPFSNSRSLRDAALAARAMLADAAGRARAEGAAAEAARS